MGNIKGEAIMGMVDEMKIRMDTINNLRARFNELKNKALMGNLDDRGHEELARLRAHFEK